jgi:hypothetical protein
MKYTQDEILYEIAKANYTDDNGDYLRCLDASNHKNCKEFMLKVVEKELEDDWSINSLFYASQELKNDVDFLLQVAKLIQSVKCHTTRGYELLEYTEPSEDTINKITNCKKTLIQFSELGVPLLDKAPQEFLDDKDVVMASVKYNKGTLTFASDRLKDDEDVVLNAISAEFTDFMLASDRLKNDKKFIIKCLKISGGVLQLVATKFKSDKHVVTQAVKTDYWAIQYACPNLQNDIELNYLAFKDDIENFRIATPDIKLKALECLYKNRKAELNNA